MGLITWLTLHSEVGQIYGRMAELEDRIYELEWAVYEQKKIIGRLRSRNRV